MTMKCKKCDGDMTLSKDGKMMICPYCGTTELVDESDAVKTERIRQDAYKEIESGKRQIESERLKHEIERDRAADDKELLKAFKKGKLSKILVIFAIISFLVAFVSLSGGFSIAGVIALAQGIIYTAAWLIGMQVFKVKFRKLYVLLAIIGFVLIIPFCGFTLNSPPSNQSEKFEWSDIALCEKLPETPKLYGEIHFNSDEQLYLTLPEAAKDDYRKYVKSCEDYGYTIESNKNDTGYDAYNPDGYKLSLSYYEYNGEMSVRLEAPEKMSQFDWPENGIATLIPAPESDTGRVIYDKSGLFEIHVGKMSKYAMSEYSKLCENAGFNVNHNRSETSYTAENPDGYSLSIQYLGFDTIRISISEPKKEETTNVSVSPETTAAPEPIETTAPTKSETQNDSEMVDGMRKEFKDAMDSYEKFFDEYIAFMEKYTESGNPVTMLADYMKYLAKYADMMSKMDALDDGGLNEKEALYYSEVTLRISQKLLALD